MKRILLHACCGPCTIYPLRRLREEGYEVTACFYNPNIHPYREFRQRLDSFRDLASQENLPVLIEERYGLVDYLRQVVFHEKERCSLCYAMRLDVVAGHASRLGFDTFSSTLLYSRYQQHTAILEAARRAASHQGINFYYEDFRVGWQEGIDAAIAQNLYRQPYCGCIYSEQERYDKTMRKQNPRKNGQDRNTIQPAISNHR